MEAAAEAFNVVLVEVALAAKDFGDDAGCAEDVGEVLLQETVLVHEELEDFERLGLGKLVVAVFEILDQESQEIGKLLFCRGKLAAAAVQFVKKLGASLVFLLSANHAGREFLEKLDVFRAGRESAHSSLPDVERGKRGRQEEDGEVNSPLQKPGQIGRITGPVGHCGTGGASPALQGPKRDTMYRAPT